MYTYTPVVAVAAVFVRPFSPALTLIRGHTLVASLHSADLLWFPSYLCSYRGLGSALLTLIDFCLRRTGMTRPEQFMSNTVLM